MCLIALAWRVHPRYELALIANRDEWHGRPTAPAAADPEHPDVHGGRDLVQGGSWLQASVRGRLAAVTNVRAGLGADIAPRSRGALVRNFTSGNASGEGFISALAPTAGEYGRFNLMLWDGASLRFASNHPRFVTHAVAPGLHAMSNGAFDAVWPKSGHATRALSAWLASSAADAANVPGAGLEPLFEALADTTPAPDDALPDTGVGLDVERVLSPPFVRGERYGTRCSSIVLVEADAITFVEHRFGPGGTRLGGSATVLGRLGR